MDLGQKQFNWHTAEEGGQPGLDLPGTAGAPAWHAKFLSILSHASRSFRIPLSVVRIAFCGFLSCARRRSGATRAENAHQLVHAATAPAAEQIASILAPELEAAKLGANLLSKRTIIMITLATRCSLLAAALA
jgi:hypothetical protein